ncbi:MAG TPA: hypothetical protein VJX67_07785 [Blastocatellia bacterium]|nr:hypothetical protein [Blastocatellia bacterium]
MIDTGAFGNAISPQAVREAGDELRDPNVGVRGLNGDVKKVFRADEVTLFFSHLGQRNQHLVVFSTDNISNSAGMEVSGFLGFSLLGLLEIKIDYRDGLVDFKY